MEEKMTSAKVWAVIFLILVKNSRGHIYSEELNQPLSELVDPFRIMKINLLWHKAKQSLPEKRLMDLYSELKMHDKKEGDLKKLKLSGHDEDGLKAARVEDKFMEIVMKFGLNEHYNYKLNEDDPARKKPQELKDPKLKKLWEKAASSGFSENELKTLRQELSHHQNKVDEYHALKDEINRFQEGDYNEIDSEGFDEYKVKKKHSALKSKYKDLKDNYQRLEEMSSDSDLTADDFSDIRVYHLWSMAKKSNMTEPELRSLREELKHFQHRLKKQEYFREQLSLSEKRLHREVKDGDYPDHHLQLQQKVKDYDYKVKKIHTDLKSRIEEVYEKHTEL